MQVPIPWFLNPMTQPWLCASTTPWLFDSAIPCYIFDPLIVQILDCLISQLIDSTIVWLNDSLFIYNIWFLDCEIVQILNSLKFYDCSIPQLSRFSQDPHLWFHNSPFIWFLDCAIVWILNSWLFDCDSMILANVCQTNIACALCQITKKNWLINIGKTYCISV